jgi:Xaa-Pro aminopeptidase
MNLTNYAERRQALKDQLKDTVAIIPAAPHQIRSFDTEYPYRQDSNLKYLTGLEEQEAVLVLAPNHPAIDEILFVLPKDPIKETWTGIRMGPDKARELLEMNHVYSIDELDQRLPDLLLGHSACALDLYASHTPWLDRIKSIMTNLNNQRRLNRAKPQSLIHLNPIIGQMRLVKDQNEILFMKKAQEITARAHRSAMAYTRPGVNESAVAALLRYHFSHHPASNEAYESIVAGGANACVLHYVSNNKELKDGDLLLIDAGADFHLYASDVTRTFPVNGVFSGIQKHVYDIVLESQKEAINLSRPGKNQIELHEATCRVLAQGLIDLKVSDESVDSIIEQGILKKYYPHSTGHWLGLDVHDPCPYTDSEHQPIAFQKGMVFTIEPGLYFPPTDHELPNQLRGIGIRIEDDVLITEVGHEVLSASIPKEIKEIEHACERDYRELMP